MVIALRQKRLTQFCEFFPFENALAIQVMEIGFIFMKPLAAHSVLMRGLATARAGTSAVCLAKSWQSLESF